MARETVLFTLPPELSEQVVLDELERAGHRFGAQVEKNAVTYNFELKTTSAAGADIITCPMLRTLIINTTTQMASHVHAAHGCVTIKAVLGPQGDLQITFLPTNMISFSSQSRKHKQVELPSDLAKLLLFTEQATLVVPLGRIKSGKIRRFVEANLVGGRMNSAVQTRPVALKGMWYFVHLRCKLKLAQFGLTGPLSEELRSNIMASVAVQCETLKVELLLLHLAADASDPVFSTPDPDCEQFTNAALGDSKSSLKHYDLTLAEGTGRKQILSECKGEDFCQKLILDAVEWLLVNPVANNPRFYKKIKFILSRTGKCQITAFPLNSFFGLCSNRYSVANGMIPAPLSRLIAVSCTATVVTLHSTKMVEKKFHNGVPEEGLATTTPNISDCNHKLGHITFKLDLAALELPAPITEFLGQRIIASVEKLCDKMPASAKQLALVHSDCNSAFSHPNSNEETRRAAYFGLNDAPREPWYQTKHLHGSKNFSCANWAPGTDKSTVILVVDSYCAMLSAKIARICLPFGAAIYHLKAVTRLGNDTQDKQVRKLKEILNVVNKEIDYEDENNFKTLAYKEMYLFSDHDPEGEGRAKRISEHVHIWSPSLARRTNFLRRSAMGRFLATNERGEQVACDNSAQFANLAEEYKKTGVCRALGLGTYRQPLERTCTTIETTSKCIIGTYQQRVPTDDSGLPLAAESQIVHLPLDNQMADAETTAAEKQDGLFDIIRAIIIFAELNPSSSWPCITVATEIATFGQGINTFRARGGLINLGRRCPGWANITLCNIGGTVDCPTGEHINMNSARYLYITRHFLAALLFPGMRSTPSISAPLISLLPLTLLRFHGATDNLQPRKVLFFPGDVLASLHGALSGEHEPKELQPQFRFYRGIVRRDPDTDKWFTDTGVERVSRECLRIAHLPVGLTLHQYARNALGKITNLWKFVRIFHNDLAIGIVIVLTEAGASLSTDDLTSLFDYTVALDAEWSWTDDWGSTQLYTDPQLLISDYAKSLRRAFIKKAEKEHDERASTTVVAMAKTHLTTELLMPLDHPARKLPAIPTTADLAGVGFGVYGPFGSAAINQVSPLNLAEQKKKYYAEWRQASVVEKGSADTWRIGTEMLLEAISQLKPALEAQEKYEKLLFAQKQLQVDQRICEYIASKPHLTETDSDIHFDGDSEMDIDMEENEGEPMEVD